MRLCRILLGTSQFHELCVNYWPEVSAEFAYQIVVLVFDEACFKNRRYRANQLLFNFFSRQFLLLASLTVQNLRDSFANHLDQWKYEGLANFAAEFGQATDGTEQCGECGLVGLQ